MRVLPVALFAVLLAACAATPPADNVPRAAGPYDGTWQFQAANTADPVCSQFVWRTLNVRGNAMGGTLSHYYGGFYIQGQIGPDGKAAFYGDGPYTYLVRGTGQFGDSQASGSVRLTGANAFCDVSWTATRQG